MRTAPSREPEHPPGGPTAREKCWAVMRIALGTAQVMAATAGLVLMVETGTSVPTMATIAVAGLLVVVSKLLFRRPGA